MGWPATRSPTRPSPSLSTTIRWSGNRVWLLSTSSDLASSSGRRWVTTTAKIFSLIPGCSLCQRLFCHGLALGLLQHLAHVPGRVLTLVRAHHVLDAPGHADDAMVDPHRGLAQPGQEFIGMAGEHQDSGALHQTLQPVLGLLQ